MKNYEQKYLLYKQKYLLLKSQKGGTSHIEIADIDETEIENELNLKNIKNFGQNNCGIIFIDKYVVKCIEKTNDILDEDENYVKYIDSINNELAGCLPKFYKWKNNKLKNYIQINYDVSPFNPLYAVCIIMEKMDGDLTKYILRKSYYETYKNMDDYDFFFERMPKTTMEYISNRVDSVENQNKYQQMIYDIKFSIVELCNCLNMKLVLLHHNLIEKGWEYDDTKIDNIGYKIDSDGDIKLYFIDIESGLRKIGQNNYKNIIHFDDYLNLNQLNRHLSDYSLLGQYDLGNIFGIDFNNFTYNFNTSIMDDVISILSSKGILFAGKNDFYKWWKFIKSGTNHSFVIQYIQGFYRIVVFDDNGLHKSSNGYNEIFPKVDKLVVSISDIYKEIDFVIY